MTNIIIERITERDLDLLILEEFHSSENFIFWFLKQLDNSLLDFNLFDNAHHSVIDYNLGESDLFIITKNILNQKLLILIENKINSDFQELQDIRYKERAIKYLEEKDYYLAKTVLIAPQNYIDNTCENVDFDYYVSYENIRDWFELQKDKRSIYKQNIINLAINKERRGYSAILNENATNFHNLYFEKVQKSFKEITMKQPKGIPAGSTFISLKYNNLRLNNELTHKLIVKKTGFGYIDWSIKNIKYEDIKNSISDCLLSEMQLKKTGNSISVSIKIPSIDVLKPFEEQIDNIEIAFTNIRTLINWINQNKDKISEMIEYKQNAPNIC
jgi:biotin-(acetyl-CoA carboxylase) ligase